MRTCQDGQRQQVTVCLPRASTFHAGTIYSMYGTSALKLALLRFNTSKIHCSQHAWSSCSTTGSRRDRRGYRHFEADEPLLRIVRWVPRKHPTIPFVACSLQLRRSAIVHYLSNCTPSYSGHHFLSPSHDDTYTVRRHNLLSDCNFGSVGACQRSCREPQLGRRSCGG